MTFCQSLLISVADGDNSEKKTLSSKLVLQYCSKSCDSCDLLKGSTAVRTLGWVKQKVWNNASDPIYHTVAMPCLPHQWRVAPADHSFLKQAPANTQKSTTISLEVRIKPLRSAQPRLKFQQNLSSCFQIPFSLNYPLALWPFFYPPKTQIPTSSFLPLAASFLVKSSRALPPSLLGTFTQLWSSVWPSEVSLRLWRKGFSS